MIFEGVVGGGWYLGLAELMVHAHKNVAFCKLGPTCY